MAEHREIDEQIDKQKLHDDIAKIKAALQSNEGEGSEEESYVGSDDDQPTTSSYHHEVPGSLLCFSISLSQ